MPHKYDCVLLCGGQSLRMKFDLSNTNKILAEVNGVPLLHHILNYYNSSHLFKRFILCLGNDSEAIRQSFCLSPNYHNSQWQETEILFLETGLNVTATDRILQAIEHIPGDNFFLGYADVLADVSFSDMVTIHHANTNAITIALAKAQMPYGRVLIDDKDVVFDFVEKPILDEWVNAGFFMINKQVLSQNSRNMELESEYMPILIKNGVRIGGYKHLGFWKGVDTYKDLLQLREQWSSVKFKLFPIH
jgi:glucose-1-phosphate cytidylyltransferase